MPRKAHGNRKHTRKDESQEGFVAEIPVKTMNKNEKIIMGILVGGIIVFLVLSIIILFGKGRKSIDEANLPKSTPTPAVKVLTTPYPTIPPITDYFMQVNEKRFYPDVVDITKGHKVTILNIGKAAITITPTTKGNTFDFGTIEQGKEKSINFDTPGVYRYTRTGKPDQSLIITVR